MNDYSGFFSNFAENSKRMKTVKQIAFLRGKGHRMVQLALLLLWAVVCFVFFQTHHAFHFFYQEQNQLFLFSNSYLASYFSKPAWLACMAGDFLTQVYYYMYAGATILTIVLLVVGDVLCRSINRIVRREASWISFGIAVGVMTVVACFSLSESYRLANIFCIIGGGVAWWLMDIVMVCGWNRWGGDEPMAHRMRPNGDGGKGANVVRMAVVVVVGAVVYWMFGYGYLVFLLLEVLSVLVLSLRKEMIRWMGGPRVVAAMVPMLLLIIPFAPRYYTLTIGKALMYPGTGHWVNLSEAMHIERILEYDNAYYFGKYDYVVQLYERENDEHTEEMSFFYCLSLEQLGQLADKLPQIQNPNLGTFLKIGEKTPMFQIKMINEMYYLLGDMTYTERAALLANTFSPNGRNVRMTKRLAEANLVSGDTVAAMKYLRLLSKTLLYRQWAADHTPGTMTPKVKAEIDSKRQFVNTTDNIRLGDDCYVILTQLLESNPKNTVALDYLLCSDMLAHQREVFIHDYETYGPSIRPMLQDVYRSAKEAQTHPDPPVREGALNAPYRE